MLNDPGIWPTHQPSTQQVVRRAIQDHYTRIANGEDHRDGDLRLPQRGGRLVRRLYSADQLARVPDIAVASFTGCGNPVSIAGFGSGARVLDLGSGSGLDCFLAAQEVGPEGEVMGIDVTAT